ncbi:hypothetical protein SKAU_G00317700 [Synaphobranchus kaupii]|uniref:Uncharacterized protein n=1 Tax=Synaphobranchus kaupii TaxID=118154 RepID=A0A9Q1IKY3_SYNKA|nr:hypothetical protein SKAU_G00317700 [Synaphobranchus kaupii]
MISSKQPLARERRNLHGYWPSLIRSGERAWRGLDGCPFSLGLGRQEDKSNTRSSPYLSSAAAYLKREHPDRLALQDVGEKPRSKKPRGAASGSMEAGGSADTLGLRTTHTAQLHRPKQLYTKRGAAV